MVGAPGGNDNAEKYKTSEERKALCELYCEHIEQGFSKRLFPECDIKTVQSYIEKYPDDFPQDKITRAEKLGELYWEKIGITGTVGKIKNFNAVSWIFNMKNRYPKNWRDKKVIEQEGINDLGAMTEEEKAELDSIRDMAVDEDDE